MIMWAMILIFLLPPSTFSLISTVPIGSIRNLSVIIANSTATSMNSAVQQCFCTMLNQSQFFSFNYFSNNQTCQFYDRSDQNKSLILTNEVNSTFYFLFLPNQNTALTTHLITLTSVATTTATWISPEYQWTFDSTLNDQSQVYNGTSINNVTFSSSTISGYGSSLSLNSSRSQGVVISRPLLNLINQSWTFEAWIYPMDIINGGEYAIVGQCSTMQDRQCLHLIIRNLKLYFGFRSDDLTGTQTLNSSTWYHVAFVFDCSTRNQTLYLNGFLDNTRTAIGCFQGFNGSLTIGCEIRSSPMRFFNGLIDQVTYINQVKTTDEIFRDATLTIYYSFDQNLTDDQGPLRINGTRYGTTRFIVGRVNESLFIDSVTDSYFRIDNLVLFGTSNRTYSISIWIRPSVIRQSAIIHFSAQANGAGSWCRSLLGLTNTSRLMSYSWNNSLVSLAGPIISVNDWTHVGITYTRVNGSQMYINGTIYSSNSPYAYSGPGQNNYLFLGSSMDNSGCSINPLINGQYKGDLDEFRLYSRQLTSNEMFALAHP